MALPGSASSTLKCSFGLAPSTLIAPPSKILVSGAPVATILDSAPMTNIPSFGMCISPSNPVVAAMIPVPPIGVIKPQPCVPMLPGTPWVGCMSKVKWSGKIPLTSDGCLTCMWGGNIKIVSAGKAKVNI